MGGRKFAPSQPQGIEIQPTVNCLQNLSQRSLQQTHYNLSDEATVTQAIDSFAFSNFCGIASSNQVPDGDTPGRFRNILIRNIPQAHLFVQVLKPLRKKGPAPEKRPILDSITATKRNTFSLSVQKIDTRSMQPVCADNTVQEVTGYRFHKADRLGR